MLARSFLRPSSFPHRPWRALATLLLLGLTHSLAAQDAPAPEPDAVPQELASARATMGTFLGAFYAGGDGSGVAIEQAVACLDLSALPRSVRGRRGQDLAIQLKAVLDRVERIDLDQLPDSADGRPWVLETGSDAGDVVIAGGDDGAWRFTSETIERIPALLRALQGRQVVEDVREGPITVAQWLRARIPPNWQESGLLLESWQWLGLAILFVLGLILERLVGGILGATVVNQLANRIPGLDRPKLSRALRPVGLFCASLLWWVGIFWLDLPDRSLTVLGVATRFAVVSMAVWAVYRLADAVSTVLQARADATAHRFDDLLVPMIRTFMKVVIAAVGLVFIVDNLGVDVTSLIAGISIGGIAIALAAQDAVKNLFGSLMVVLDRPFAVGDSVVIGSVEGTVEEVGFRSTRIRTFYNSLVTLPNANLISASVDNYGARQYRRWRTHFGLTYDTPPEKIEAFCDGVRALIEESEHTRKEGYQVRLHQFSASSLDVLMHLFFATTDWSVELAERHRMSIEILKLAERLGVSFAFPSQSVYVESMPDATTGTAGIERPAP